jgi:hypothetical protein
MDKHRIPKRLPQIKTSEKRPRGRPRTWWIHQVKRDVKKRGWDWMMVDEMQEWADRDSLRLLCMSTHKCGNDIRKKLKVFTVKPSTFFYFLTLHTFLTGVLFLTIHS